MIEYGATSPTTAAAAVVREKGFSPGKGRWLGMVGLRSAAPTEIFGVIPAGW